MRPDAVGRTAGKTITLRRLAQPWTLILIATGLFQLFRGAPVDGAFFAVIAALLIADAAGWLPRTTPRRPRAARRLAAWLLAAAVPLGIALVLAPRHGVVEGFIVAGIGVSTLLLGWNPPAGPDTDAAGTDAGGAGAEGTDAGGTVLGDSDRSATRPTTTGPTTTGQTAAGQTGAGPSNAGPNAESPGTATPVEGAPDSMPPAIRRAAILWSVIAVTCCLWEVAAFLLGLPSPEAEFDHPSISDLLDPVLGTIQGRIAFTTLWLLVGVALLAGARSGDTGSRGIGATGAAGRSAASRGTTGRRARSRVR